LVDEDSLVDRRLKTIRYQDRPIDLVVKFAKWPEGWEMHRYWLWVWRRIQNIKLIGIKGKCRRI